MFPNRSPLAVMDVKVRTVTTAVFPSAANQELPGPSAPAGHKMLEMLLNCESVDEGEPKTCAFWRGRGTREEVNGVAPGEKGTLGLFVPLTMAVPFPWNDVMNEPAKKRLDSEELVVMERTRASAPVKPSNGGFDHDAAFTSHTATADPGDVKLPPTQTLLSFVSQNMASTSPFGPPVPRAANAPDEGVYDATLLAEVLSIEEKAPAK